MDRARSFVGSFEGDITARKTRPGVQRMRYLDSDSGRGSCLTSTDFYSPVDAYHGLYLAPWKRLGLTRQVVVNRERALVFEGLVKDGRPGASQTLITDLDRFDFGSPYRY